MNLAMGFFYMRRYHYYTIDVFVQPRRPTTGREHEALNRFVSGDLSVIRTSYDNAIVVNIDFLLYRRMVLRVNVAS